MHYLVWLVIAGYFGSLAGLIRWVMKRNQDTAADYFLANRNLGWFIVGASIFASTIGSEHLVALAGSGAMFTSAAESREGTPCPAACKCLRGSLCHW